MKRLQWKSAAARRLMSMAGTPDVEKAIQQLVDRHCTGIARVPVDLEELAARLGVLSIVKAPLTVAGELRRVAGGLEIVCEESLSEGRRRFTIAHELGHALLEKSGRGAPRHGRELERLCDRVAVEILLPRDRVDQEFPASPRLADIERVSRQFRVSLSATALRAAELRRCASFEVSSAGVVWSGGAMRRLPGAAQPAVDRALAGEKASEVLYLYDRGHEGSWRIETLPMGQSGSALILLSRVAAAELQRSDGPHLASRR